MKKIAKELKNLLVEKSLTISVAESITGGYISKTITDVPGSSKIFKGAIIAYNNEIKVRLLNIPIFLIEKKGSVSKETAILLARNVKDIFGSDIGIGVTGVAGPEKSENKPIGIVYGSISFDKDYVFKWSFCGNREEIRKMSVINILNNLINIIRR